MMTRQGEGSSESTRCQDCGNQAKKDCVYLRCRTCCKTRGFECQTHVRSTWVPVSKRHQKQQHHLLQHFSSTQQQQQPLGPNPKRYKQNPSLGFMEGNFPAEVTMPAVFRCVRVTSVENAVDQYAYKTSVNIGGHIFKGILYDQGPKKLDASGGEYSSHRGLQQPNFITTTTTTGAATGGAVSPPPPCYPSPFSGAFMPGMPFFHYPKS